jgi:hypothetical protein
VSYFDYQSAPVLSDPRRTAARQQLEQVVAQSAPARRGQSRRRKWMVSGAIILSVVVVSCAVAVARYQRITDRTQSRCYTVADVSGYYLSIGMASTPGHPADVRRAMSICQSLYRQGFLRPGKARVYPRPGSGTRHQVPALVVCTLPGGAAGVFPGGRKTCSELGMPEAQRP